MRVFNARTISAVVDRAKDQGRSSAGIVVLSLQWILFALAALVVLLTARMLFDGSQWLQHGMDRLDEKAPTGEVVSAFENAARSYVPGSPYPPRALWHLAIMARSAAMRGDVSGSLHIWEVLRRSVLATRHVMQPNEGYLQLAEKQIVRLRSGMLDKDGMAVSPDATIRRPDDPSVLFTFLLLGGLVLWVAASFGLILKGRNRESGSRSVLLGVALIGAGLWMSMSWLA